MAPSGLTHVYYHPYSGWSKQHRHFKPTEVSYGPYTAACVPFRWLTKADMGAFRDQYDLGLDEALEPPEVKSSWVQDARNHQELLDTFFGHIVADQSLCFFYSPQLPFLDDSVRGLVGVGKVQRVGAAVEYEYSALGGLRSLIWEREIRHSIRPDCRDGFLLPYHLALERGIDPASIAALVPTERSSEFTYGCEHVTHDGAIGSLLAIRDSIEAMKNLTSGPWDHCLEWLNLRLGEIWKLRGPFPGLGSALSAFGFPMANFIAREAEKSAGVNEDPWPFIRAAVEDPAAKLPASLANHVSGLLRDTFLCLPGERLALLMLLSRFELTPDQARMILDQGSRQRVRIGVTDADIIRDPYILPEVTRFTPSPIDFYTIDRGAFPPAVQAIQNPVPEPSRMDGPSDRRRVRGTLVETLEQAADEGHTLLPRTLALDLVNRMKLDPPSQLTSDTAAALEESLGSSVQVLPLPDHGTAYQLRRLSDMGRVIKEKVSKRRSAPKLSVHADWRHLLAQIVPLSHGDQLEDRAIAEKIDALTELARSRISVLLGPAGTGKTTVLATLCSQPDIAAGGILLLAPTGKARVRLRQAAGGTHVEAFTIAQFLTQRDRFDPTTQTYRLSQAKPFSGARTVIVDEASMLTENMLGALLDGITGVDRLILVGDPQQLPPIGAGRPFVDIVAELRPAETDRLQIKVGSCYAELTIRRRQIGEDRADMHFAEWFSGRSDGAGEDSVFDAAVPLNHGGSLTFVRWDSPSDLESKLDEVLKEELSLSGDGYREFDLSLGATEWEHGTHFRGGAAASIEKWQILTPVRQMGFGVEALNRRIHQKYRANWLAKSCKAEFERKIPKALGPQQIVFGDKVICTTNHARGNEAKWPRVWPTQDCQCYLSNGEIGVAVGQYKTKAMTKAPWELEVEFSSQQGFKYKFRDREFLGDDGVPPLELAYALTVHRAQGSEFELVLLILPNPCRLLSRELLYTALTRQRQRVVVLHQGPLHDLRKYGSSKYSEAASRITNLFRPPSIVDVDGTFLEEGLIHRTCDGIAVRSKSEVIIYDALVHHGLKPIYEQPLVLGGVTRYPDFTIYDDDLGLTYYWEHCGMLFDAGYRVRWEAKKDWYHENGVGEMAEDTSANKVLIVTSDDHLGGISSQMIGALIDKVFGAKPA